MREVMYSDGRCPYCGYKGRGACTIVACEEYGWRYKHKPPWWKFWEKPTYEYKERNEWKG